jgi:folate-dependent phosphoribosylglycinamide formyltransferase PurN
MCVCCLLFEILLIIVYLAIHLSFKITIIAALLKLQYPSEVYVTTDSPPPQILKKTHVSIDSATMVEVVLMGKGSQLAYVMKEISKLQDAKVVAFVRPREFSFLEECFAEVAIQGIPILDHHEKIYGLFENPLILSMYYDRILSSFFCKKYFSVNLHNSLLPKFRGVRPIEYALKFGEKEIGVTLHKMDAGIDTGPIISQERVVVSAEDTAYSLRTALARLGAKLLIEFVAKYPSFDIKPQDESQSSYFSKYDAVKDGLW